MIAREPDSVYTVSVRIRTGEQPAGNERSKNMIKQKTISLLISIMLVFLTALAPVSAACAEGFYGAGMVHQMEERELSVYIGSMETWLQLGFFFMDGVEDLPWVEMESWCDFMNRLYQSMADEGYLLTFAAEGERITLTRENGFFMMVDFSSNEIYFNDFNMFVHNSTDSSLLDILSQSGFNDQGEAALFQRISKGTFDRLGDAVTLPLADYGIHLIHQDGKGYIPFQTLGDFLITPSLYQNTFFNGKAVFIATRDCFGTAAEGYTPLGEYYYSAQPCQRSAELAEYGYNELCLMLDCMYGLKEIHEISGFQQLFWQIGYDKYLKGTDPLDADIALDAFIDIYLDDLHSAFNGYSWMSGPIATADAVGTTNNAYFTNLSRYLAARTEAMGDNPPMYMEVGNTAYITFDLFYSSPSGESYYESISQGVFPSDTIGLIIYAHSQIYRQDSPIRNVVFDLSCNYGGSVDSALFVIGWVLGNAPFCVKDTFTGALSTVLYRGDVNLDRQFNSNDEVDDKDLYCLISPVSFSCGNLVPAVFKNSQKVTLIGRTTGGGSCVIMPVSTAWGTMLQISGSQRMSFFKNGSFYDIDQGIEPDIYLSHLSTFYNREELTELINGLH